MKTGTTRYALGFWRRDVEGIRLREGVRATRVLVDMYLEGREEVVQLLRGPRG